MFKRKRLSIVVFIMVLSVVLPFLFIIPDVWANQDPPNAGESIAVPAPTEINVVESKIHSLEKRLGEFESHLSLDDKRELERLYENAYQEAGKLQQNVFAGMAAMCALALLCLAVLGINSIAKARETARIEKEQQAIHKKMREY